MEHWVHFWLPGITIASCVVGAVGAFTADNTVIYKGKTYGTLDFHEADGSATGCQGSPKPMPAGWHIAPHDRDSVAVIVAHSWNTDVIVLADGAGIDAAGFRHPGKPFNDRNWLKKSWDEEDDELAFQPRFCWARVLIVNDHFTTEIHYKDMTYATLDYAEVDGSTQGCQRSLKPLPAGWHIAPHDRDSVAVIASHSWSTDVIVLADGIAIDVAGSLMPAGQPFEQDKNWLKEDGKLFAAKMCNARILIVKKDITNQDITITGAQEQMVEQPGAATHNQMEILCAFSALCLAVMVAGVYTVKRRRLPLSESRKQMCGPLLDN